MPVLQTAADVLKLKERLKGSGYTRIPQYREVIDRKMRALASLKDVMAPEYAKAFVPYQSGNPSKVLFRMTNIMASNQSEIRIKARSTDPTKISQVQRHEHGHEALDPILFPMPVRRRSYSFLADSYTILALDVTPKPGSLSKYADREKLQASADGEYDEGEDTPEASYSRAYKRTKTDKTERTP